MRTVTRNGKIARIPRQIRETLNQRLLNGEQGIKLVKWLNSLMDVKMMLEDEFGDRPITEQNLSEWKQGGYQEWLRHQDELDLARTLTEQGTALTEEAGYMALSDRIAPAVALALSQMIRAVTSGPLKTPKQRREALMLFRELALLRERDHKAAEINQALKKRHEEESRKKEKALNHPFERRYQERLAEVMQAMNRERMIRLLTEGMSPEFQKNLRDYLLGESATLKGQNKSSSSGSDPGESDSIQLDQTAEASSSDTVPCSGGMEIS